MKTLKMTIIAIAMLSTLFAHAQRTVTLINQSDQVIWVGLQGKLQTSPGVWVPVNPENGGFRLEVGASKTISSFPLGWEGRFWGRTGCNFDANGNGTCETGSCGNGLYCNGLTGTPSTLAEIKFNGYLNQDFYDISLVDGFNLPMQILPVPGTFTPTVPSTKYTDKPAGCPIDLNLGCPTELQTVNSSGKVVGCLSACSKFHSDIYCCTNAYNDPVICKPTSYSQFFKAACPDAYSYAYDDQASTFVCTGAQYQVIFGGNSSAVATFYKDCNYAGTAVGLAPGTYTLAQLQAKGILNNDISSLRVQSGYTVTLYADDNFSGATVIKTADDGCLVDDSFNDLTTSLKIIKTTTGSSTFIQAENYSSMAGIITETTTDTDGGQNVGAIDTGDWLAYNNINFPTTGTYKVEYRVASLSGGGRLSMDLNAGSIILGYLDIPSTGSWQNWTTISHNVTVNAGTYNVGIYAQAGGWNINWFRITKTDGARIANTEKTPEKLSLYPNPVRDQLTLKAPFDLDNIKVQITNANGIIVINKKVINNTINVSNLPAGIYWLTIVKDGKKHTISFVK
ncbi:Por secretion system C-terminal sorting domain-containing protein [Chitinophaga sp. YR573]|uniref:thaumatin family protein n=1 Tax=Chitinophaga sp. YR573 TaxID=1881040 RepID=UPI0008C6B3C0|nr:thaumatin family protein [Chitinophaga sp. YR573]SEW40051.1 Por secretion system C-terminal sorting domain-containing protein [Chitinophaga sp. YR573]